MAAIIVLVFALAAIPWIEAPPFDDDDLFLSCEKPLKCRENEYFKYIASTCQPTCEDPNPTFCNKIGMSNCECKEGYIRNSIWDCIKKEDCPPQNRENNDNDANYIKLTDDEYEK